MVTKNEEVRRAPDDIIENRDESVMTEGEIAAIEQGKFVVSELKRLAGETERHIDSQLSSRSYGFARRGMYNLMAVTGRMLVMVDELMAMERKAKGLPPLRLMPWEKDPLDL